MVELSEAPFPPGHYPLVVVGSGPGALQLTYSLRQFGIEHAVFSEDPAPGGMFRRWPVFQRMLSWTKPYAEHKPGMRAYERYDWNSLLADEQQNRAVMTTVMDGTSYFPSRPEMQQGLVRFAESTGLTVRYGCRWEATRRDGQDFVLETSDGEYRSPIAIFAVGVAEPWKPQVLSVDGVQEYGGLRPVETYADRRVFIAGKQNSGFEIASGLLPLARQIVLASPSRTKLSVDTRTLVGVRPRGVDRERRTDRSGLSRPNQEPERRANAGVRGRRRDRGYRFRMPAARSAEPWSRHLRPEPHSFPDGILGKRDSTRDLLRGDDHAGLARLAKAWNAEQFRRGAGLSLQRAGARSAPCRVAIWPHAQSPAPGGE